MGSDGVSAGNQKYASFGHMCRKEQRLTTLIVHTRTPVTGLVFHLPRGARKPARHNQMCQGCR